MMIIITFNITVSLIILEIIYFELYSHVRPPTHGETCRWRDPSKRTARHNQCFNQWCKQCRNQSLVHSSNGSLNQWSKHAVQARAARLFVMLLAVMKSWATFNCKLLEPLWSAAITLPTMSKVKLSSCTFTSFAFHSDFPKTDGIMQIGGYGRS